MSQLNRNLGPMLKETAKSEEVEKVDKKQSDHHEVNLKGTLISVFFVGIVIVAMWVAVYLMYVAR